MVPIGLQSYNRDRPRKSSSQRNICTNDPERSNLNYGSRGKIKMTLPKSISARTSVSGDVFYLHFSQRETSFRNIAFFLLNTEIIPHLLIYCYF